MSRKELLAKLYTASKLKTEILNHLEEALQKKPDVVLSLILDAVDRGLFSQAIKHLENS